MIFRILAALFLLCSAANAAALLPPGKQQFLKENGAPNAGGSVYFYVPGTTTPKDTYQDAGATILNTNPVGLDSGGFAVIYGSGSYRMVVKDASGSTIYDQLTSDPSAQGPSWGGTSTGSANAIIVAASGFSAQNGQVVSWINGFTNTGPTTVTIGGVAYGIDKDGPAGPIPLTGGELIAGGIATAVYDSGLGIFHLEITSIIGGPFPGELRIFAMNACPIGWQEANGSAVSRTGFPGAFAAMGTTWGVGDGSTTFNLPDMRGVVPRGWDHGRGLDPAAPAFAAYQADSLGSHSHTITDPGHSHTYTPPNANTSQAGVAASANITVTASTSTDLTGITGTNATGAAETRAKANIILFCVKM